MSIITINIKPEMIKECVVCGKESPCRNKECQKKIRKLKKLVHLAVQIKGYHKLPKA